MNGRVFLSRRRPHRQFRKVTKTKSIFPNDDSLRKMLYLGGSKYYKKMDNAISKLGHDPDQLEILNQTS